jgi:hypothetical protein
MLMESLEEIVILTRFKLWVVVEVIVLVKVAMALA